MRKLSLFLVTLFVLSSCSSDENLDNPQVETKTQTVNFEIESNSFKLTSNPLKAGVVPSHNLLQYVVYKETGEVFLNKVLYEEDLAGIVTSTYAPLSMELPIGKYHVAILSTLYNYALPELYVIKPVNYNTDYYLKTSTSYIGSNNEGVYYETFDLVVKENMTTQTVELKPMWSVIEFVIENSKTVTMPAGTEDLQVVLDTYCDGFYVKSKLSKKTSPTVNFPLFKMLTTIRNENTSSFKLSTTLNENRDVTLRVNYRKTEGTVIIDTKVIKVFQPENGKNYLISGNLANMGNPQAPLNITFGKLDETVIKLPY